MNAVTNTNTLKQKSTIGVENLNVSFLYFVHADMKSAKEIIINMQIESASIPKLLDTGAKVRLQTNVTWIALRSPQRENSSVVLQTYSGQKCQ